MNKNNLRIKILSSEWWIELLLTQESIYLFIIIIVIYYYYYYYYYYYCYFIHSTQPQRLESQWRQVSTRGNKYNNNFNLNQKVKPTKKILSFLFKWNFTVIPESF